LLKKGCFADDADDDDDDEEEEEEEEEEEDVDVEDNYMHWYSRHSVALFTT
jgi:hypothetical protein